MMPRDKSTVVVLQRGANQGMKLEMDSEVPLYYWLREDHDQTLVTTMRPLVQRGTTALDIGANIGFYTMMMARWVGPEGQVLSFDPDPDALRRLRRHTELNALSNVVSVPKAVSDQNEMLAFRVLGNGWSQVIGEDNGASEGVISVDCVRLDDFMSTRNVESVSFMKIDVENHEVRVLQGGRETLKRYSPHLIIEVHSAESLRGCTLELFALGYDVRPMDNGPMFERIMQAAKNGEAISEEGFERGQILCSPGAARS
jgi:FkbM family methyltransferase